MYARSQNYGPETNLHTRHRSGYISFVNPTKQAKSEESRDPLLIVQTVGVPSKESER